MDIKGRTVLIVDDDKFMREFITSVLRAHKLFDNFIFARNGLEGYKRLKNNYIDVDLVISDLNMPEYDGYKFLAFRENLPELKQIPVIIITGVEEKESEIKGLEMGANDYLVKPVGFHELIVRVKNLLKVKILQDELIKKNLILEKLSNIDYLTGINNRRYFMMLFEKEFSRSLRYNRSLSFIIFDIDHFKLVNDTYGHQIGDDVLTDVVDLISKNLRKHDIFGRYGGEEFTLLLPETDYKGALLVAERHRRRIENNRFGGDNKFQVTISAGITSYPEENYDTLDEMIIKADESLYYAKNTGRNKVVLYKDIKKYTANSLKNNK